MTVQDAAGDLSRVVRELRDGQPVGLTRDGRIAAVLLHTDEFDSLLQTLAWLQSTDVHEDVADARRALEHGTTRTADELRARYDLESE